MDQEVLWKGKGAVKHSPLFCCVQDNAIRSSPSWKDSCLYPKSIWINPVFEVDALGTPQHRAVSSSLPVVPSVRFSAGICEPSVFPTLKSTQSTAQSNVYSCSNAVLLREGNHRANDTHRWASTVKHHLQINLINPEQKVTQLGHTYWRNLSLRDSWHIILQNKKVDKEILKR